MTKGKIFEGAYDIRKILESGPGQLKAEKSILAESLISGKFRAQEKYDGLHVGAYRLGGEWRIDYRGLILDPLEAGRDGPFRRMVADLFAMFEHVDAFPGTYIQIEYCMEKPTLMLKSPSAVLSVNKATSIHRTPWEVEYSITKTYEDLEKFFADALGLITPREIAIPVFPSIDEKYGYHAHNSDAYHNFLQDCAVSLYSALNNVERQAEGFVIRTSRGLFKLQKEDIINPEYRARKKKKYFETMETTVEECNTLVDLLVVQMYETGTSILNLNENYDRVKVELLAQNAKEEMPQPLRMLNYCLDRAYQISAGKLAEECYETS